MELKYFTTLRAVVTVAVVTALSAGMVDAQAAPSAAADRGPGVAAAAAPADAQQEARRAANLAIYQRMQAEKAVAAKATAVRAEVDRLDDLREHGDEHDAPPGRCATPRTLATSSPAAR